MDHYLDSMDNHIEDMKGTIKNKNDQRLAGLQLQFRQPRPTAKADEITDKETRVRKEDAALQTTDLEISRLIQRVGPASAVKNQPNLQLP